MSAEAIADGLKIDQDRKNSGSDHVYYNATFYNGTPNPNGIAPTINAIYREVRSDPLIQKPEDWYMSVVRLKVPLANVPLFYFENISFTAIGQSQAGSPILDHFPQVLILQGYFQLGSNVITNIIDPTGNNTNVSGLRTGPLTMITQAASSDSASSIGPVGLIPNGAYISSATADTITMSLPAGGKIVQNTAYFFMVDTASGFGENPVPNFYNLATIQPQPTSPPPVVPILNPTGSNTTDASGTITLESTTTTQLIRQTNSTVTNLWPPGEQITVVSTPYNLSLEYMGTFFSALVVPTAPTILDRYFVFSIQEYLDAVNNGFEQAFTALKAAFPGFPGSHPPYVYFNPVEKLFGIVAEYGAWTNNNPAGGTIYLGFVLYEFFQNFLAYSYLLNTPGLPAAGFAINIASLGASAAFPSGNLFTVAVGADPYNNVVAYEALNQLEQTSSLCQWNHIEKLLIVSGSLPVQYEYLSTAPSLGGAYIQSSANFQAILVDFIISEVGVERCEAIYNADPYRLIDLRGNSPLRSIDMQILYQDRELRNYPLEISPGQYAEVKLLFRKKFLDV